MIKKVTAVFFSPLRSTARLTLAAARAIAGELGAELAEIDHYLRHFCTYFGYDMKELLDSPFTVVMPDSKNPYRQMYVAN